jgi:hypothetical protein
MSGRTLFRSGTRWRHVAVIAMLVVFLTVHRSPAPIVETPDNPTPAPEQASKPKWKPRTKTKTFDNESAKAPTASSGPARFAGNWAGTISQGIWGNVKVTLSINAEGTSVKMAAGERPATVSGNTISWKSGIFNEIGWTLAPQGGGSTALVTSKSGLGVNGSATFTRTQRLANAPPPSMPAPTIAATPPPNLPTAKPVSDKPGFVYNPFDPTGKAIFDVHNQTHGATVRDPASGRLFVIP